MTAFAAFRSSAFFEARKHTPGRVCCSGQTSYDLLEMASLFEDLPLVGWLPGETLFSLCSRLHVLWGHRLPRRTATLLFGHHYGGTHHDLPNRIDRFVAATSGVFGSSQEVACQRTLLRYYGAFIPGADLAHAAEVMRGDSVAHLKLYLGILTSRFRANHPLKACLACIEQDVSEHAWAYWHLTHQYPGVWTCPAHGLPLLTSTQKSTGVDRFGWHLPEIDKLVSPADRQYDDASSKHFQRLTALTVRLVEGDLSRPLDLAGLPEMYRGALGQRGWLTSAGSLRVSAIAAAFAEYVGPLRVIPEFASLPATVDEARVQLGRLFREPRTGTHPLRHVILMDWLLRDIGSEARAANVVPEGRPARAKPSHNLEQRHRLIQAVSRGDTAISALARGLGIDPATAMNWAAEAGCTSPRRPKLLKEPLRFNVIKSLMAGADKKEVAERFGISVPTVTRVLRTEVGLGKLWTKARTDHARCRAREAWTNAVRDLGHLGTKAMRQSESSAYAWLYRNDREWLRQHQVARVQPELGVRVDWMARDRELSVLVEKAAAQHFERGGDGPLRLWHLYQVVPELKAKLQALKRLPLTRQTIDAVLGRRTTSADQDLFAEPEA